MLKMTDDIKGITEISGFGKNTAYENECQKMLQAGYEWIEARETKAKLEAKTYKNIYGILEPTSEDAKELSKVVGASVPDCSGAMHQAVMGHLFYINNNGLKKWKTEVNKKNEEYNKN